MITNIALLLCLLANMASAQVDSSATLPLQVINAEGYKAKVEEVRYVKDGSELLPREFEDSEEQKEKKKRKKDKRSTTDFSFLNGSLMKLLMYGLVGVLVLFLIWAILSNIKLKEGELEAAPIEETDEIEDIEAVDTDAGYNEALANGDYRLACRMLFLKVLQRLETTERIRWKKEKTNRHYLQEMAADEQVAVFRDIIVTYEKVWYGDKPIDFAGLQLFAAQASKFTPLKLPTDV